jgi:hypothetical protein
VEHRTELLLDQRFPPAGGHRPEVEVHDYYDHREPVEKLSIFDLAARLQPETYRGWRAAVKILGRRFVWGRRCP